MHSINFMMRNHQTKPNKGAFQNNLSILFKCQHDKRQRKTEKLQNLEGMKEKKTTIGNVNPRHNTETENQVSRKI